MYTAHCNRDVEVGSRADRLALTIFLLLAQVTLACLVMELKGHMRRSLPWWEHLPFEARCFVCNSWFDVGGSACMGLHTPTVLCKTEEAKQTSYPSRLLCIQSTIFPRTLISLIRVTNNTLRKPRAHLPIHLITCIPR